MRIVALERGEEISSGSGTVVDRKGLIYTNRHVVEGGDDYRVEILEDPNEPPAPQYRARVLGYSMDVDFAVLQIDRDSRGQPIAERRIDLPYLSAVADGVQRGDGIFVFGYPGIGDGYLAFTEGIITTIRNGTMNNRRLPVWYQTDTPIAPGNSGGLAVNARGEMVGIPTTVRTEERTGGRFGGILAVNAVRAALDGGLETDLSRIAAATIAPVIEGGTLDFGEVPTFGSAALSAGFEPDPHTLEMVSGGEVQADYLGGECAGYAAVAPDFRVNWSGTSSELRIFFVAEDGGDTTLLVNLPDGSWTCNDDTAETLDPMVVLRDPSRGQYDIWVGSYEPGAFISGTLHLTERNLDPVSVGPARASSALSLSRSESSEQRIHTALTRVASIVNANLPMRVDEETELMNVGVFGDTLAYNYRLVNVDIPTADLGDAAQAIVAALRPGVVRQACSTPETHELLSEGVTMRYAYHDETREYITALDVTQLDCR